MKYIPSYDEYRKIIHNIKDTGKLFDYWEAIDKDEFIILRHDVEFSIERAYKMAAIEKEEDIKSTYFIQITNNAYNALSMQNRKIINKIFEMGHSIGLHYHLNGVTDPLKTKDRIREQIRIMSEMCGIPVDRFSMHRPVKEVYYYSILIEGIINAYSPEFFTLIDESAEYDDSKLKVKYIADSRHKWNYGYPDYETLNCNKKIQLLIHPDFWSVGGYDAEENFVELIHENSMTYIETLDEECKHFALYKEKIKEDVTQHFGRNISE